MMKFITLTLLTFASSFSIAAPLTSLVCSGTLPRDFDVRHLVISKNPSGVMIAQYSKENDDGGTSPLATYFNIKVTSVGLGQFEYSGTSSAGKGSFTLSGTAVNQSFIGQLEITNENKSESLEITCSLR